MRGDLPPPTANEKLSKEEDPVLSPGINRIPIKKRCAICNMRLISLNEIMGGVEQKDGEGSEEPSAILPGTSADA